MQVNIPVLLAAGSGLLAIAATSFSSNSDSKLPLSITHDAANRAVNLGFDAKQTDRYYLIEGCPELDTGDWSLSYGVKGDGQSQSHPMPTMTDKFFYRLIRVRGDDLVLKKDYDGDKVVLLEELDRGLDGFETVPADTNGDTIPNDYEAIHGLDKTDAVDADGDGASNVLEYTHGSNPRDPADSPTVLKLKVHHEQHLNGEPDWLPEDEEVEHINGDIGFYAKKIAPKRWDPPRNLYRSTYIDYSILESISGSTPFQEIALYRKDQVVLHTLDSSHYGPLEYDISGPNGLVEVDYYSWDGKDFRRNGDTVSLPFQYFKDPLPLGHIRTYPVDLDILHPASGELKERLEDKDHDSEGGYVALKRAVEGEDLAPVTRLVLRATELPDKDSFWRNTFHTTSSNFEDLFAPAPDWLKKDGDGGKHRLKFDSGGRYRIYQDADRTEEIFTEDTEFPADKETTVYLEGLKKSDDLGGETVTLQVGLSGNWTDTDSVDFTIPDLEAYKSIDDFNSVPQRIGNDASGGPQAVDEKHKTVLLEFAPADFFVQHADRLTFEVTEVEEQRDGEAKRGRIDATRFRETGGKEPIRYIAPAETQDDRHWDDPDLDTRKISFRVLLDGNEIVHVGLDRHRILIYSRFDYYWKHCKKPSESRRAADLIDYVLWKYNLSFPFSPKYDGNMEAAGETRSNGLWWDGVYLGNDAFKSEHFLASTLIHENVHYRSGKENVKRSGDGSVAYDKWVASDFTRRLSTRDVENIYRWINGEYAVINAEKNHVTYSYMKQTEKDEIKRYLKKMRDREEVMKNHGYSNPKLSE